MIDFIETGQNDGRQIASNMASFAKDIHIVMSLTLISVLLMFNMAFNF